jgi:hypothetical protein
MNNSDYIVKPVATALVAYAVDQFLFKESDSNKSISVAVSAGVGATTGMMVGSVLPSFDLGTYFGNGKGLSQRVAEVGLGAGASYVLNTVILKNVGFRESPFNKLPVFLIADVAGEYVADYIAGRPLAIFA